MVRLGESWSDEIGDREIMGMMVIIEKVVVFEEGGDRFIGGELSNLMNGEGDYMRSGGEICEGGEEGSEDG